MTFDAEGMLASLMPALALAVAVYLFCCLMLGIIARKTQTSGAWTAWIPIVNMFLLLRVARRPAWWFLLFLIPLVNIVMAIVVWMAIAGIRGKPRWLGVLLLVPLLNFLVLAYLALSGPGEAAPPVPTPRIQQRQPAAAPACTACGAAIEADEQFCGNCGQPVGAPRAAATQIPEHRPDRKGRGPAVVVVTVAVLIVAVGLFLWNSPVAREWFGMGSLAGFFGLGGEETASTPAPDSRPPTVSPQPVPVGKRQTEIKEPQQTVEERIAPKQPQQLEPEPDLVINGLPEDLPPEQRKMVEDMIRQGQAGDSRIKPTVIGPYQGSSNGTLVWSGEAEKDMRVTITMDHADKGLVLSGSLPGEPCAISISDPNVAVVEAPGPSNGFARLVLRFNRKGKTSVSINWRALR